MDPDEATVGKLQGLVQQIARALERPGRWKPERWHADLARDHDLGWALARRDATCARNRVRAVVARHWQHVTDVPNHVRASLRYLGVVLDVQPRSDD